ncbi:NTE family protein [Rubrivivax gelatinosus]|uniref:patatin-like phospholipase family protein n=2 Tax=Rubrivivax gelatinosus TaxID=28068 RepID=UPI001A18A474|nr:patatin-like phospholipase family protein [Rubrivivax gelatinosus]MBG6080735.1 NTE family protein [Rubrivivax gelatinosus]
MTPTSRRLAALAGLLLALPPTLQAADIPPRPKVGLVLSGGGARGAAHVGVLEVLDRLHVPVDCVAGTSMGALVAGAWVAGVPPQTMREELGKANWNDMFQDNPDYVELNVRNKQIERRFLPGTESGVGTAGLIGAQGVVTGQKIKLFFNQIVRAQAGERDLGKLPLPLSMVATDIGTGERVVLRSGSLTQAMRASMAVPGLLLPLDLEGRRLVDGGIVDNLPVGEVRARCGAEVVIAVNVGSPLLRAEEVTGVLSLTAQMVAILTEQNVAQSLATLKEGDVYIKPDLSGITAADFDRSAEAADRGRAAAEALAPALARLAVPEAQYAAWRRRLEDHRPDVDRVDAIEVAGLNRVNPEALLRHVQQRVGEPLDTETLNRDLVRAYGDGYYQGVDYTLLTVHDKRVLRITPIEKPWGPDYLRFGLNFDSNVSQGSTYSLRAGYQKTWLNTLGAEALLEAEVGNVSAASLELYQPLESSQTWFVQANAGYRRERADVFQNDRRTAEYLVSRDTLELRLGLNLGLYGQASIGRRNGELRPRVDTGDASLSSFREPLDGWEATLDLDQLDQLHFPTSGWAARLAWFSSSDRGYTRLDADARLAWSYGDWVLGTRAAWTGSTRGTLPVWDSATLGGFLNVSAYASGQLRGDDMRYGQLRAERIVGRLPLGLRGDMRFGMAWERARLGLLYTETQRTGWLDSATAYLGGDTPIGAVYVGVGRSRDGASNAYLFIGTP